MDMNGNDSVGILEVAAQFAPQPWTAMQAED